MKKNIKKSYKKTSGFTLIELLVVISIIGVLVAVVALSSDVPRNKARNESFQASMVETQLALRLYKAQVGRYPEAHAVVAGCGSASFGINKASSINCTPDSIIVGVDADFVGNFIDKLPSHTDSANSGCDVVYQVPDDGSWYKLTAIDCHKTVPPNTGMQAGDQLARCPNLLACVAGYCSPGNAAFIESYAIYSKGGECKQ